MSVDNLMKWEIKYQPQKNGGSDMDQMSDLDIQIKDTVHRYLDQWLNKHNCKLVKKKLRRTIRFPRSIDISSFTLPLNSVEVKIYGDEDDGQTFYASVHSGSNKGYHLYRDNNNRKMLAIRKAISIRHGGKVNRVEVIVMDAPGAMPEDPTSIYVGRPSTFKLVNEWTIEEEYI